MTTSEPVYTPPAPARSFREMTSALEFIGKSKRSSAPVTSASASTGTESTGTSPASKSSVSVNVINDRTENPYIDAIYKRLRTLRKRLQRLQKYEELLTTYTQDELEQRLNADQRRSLKERDGLIASIRELEETQKQLLVIDIEQAQLEQAKKRDQAREKRQAVATAMQEAKLQGDRVVETLTRFFYATVVLLASPIDGIRPTEQELAPLVQFQQRLFTSLQQSTMLDSHLTLQESDEGEVAVNAELVAMASKLAERDEEMFVTDASYALVQQVVDRLYAPPVQAASFGVEGDISEFNEPLAAEIFDSAVHGALTVEESTMLYSAESGDSDEMYRHKVVPPGGFCFVHSSEIFDVEEPEMPDPISVQTATTAEMATPDQTVEEEPVVELAAPIVQEPAEQVASPTHRQHRRRGRQHSVAGYSEQPAGATEVKSNRGGFARGRGRGRGRWRSASHPAKGNVAESGPAKATAQRAEQSAHSSDAPAYRGNGRGRGRGRGRGNARGRAHPTNGHTATATTPTTNSQS